MGTVEYNFGIFKLLLNIIVYVRSIINERGYDIHRTMNHLK